VLLDSAGKVFLSKNEGKMWEQLEFSSPIIAIRVSPYFPNVVYFFFFFWIFL